MLPKTTVEGVLDRAQLQDLILGHHREIETLLIEAEKALQSFESSRGRTLASIRWQLVRQLRNYQLFKHHELFDPISRSQDADQATLAIAMKARCITAGEAYDRHVRRWSASDIEAAWRFYQEDSRAMIALIKGHLARESTEIRALLSPGCRSQLTLVDKAAQMRDLRDYRYKLFKREIFEEPAWDILLDLFIAESGARQLCTSANEPSAAHSRWLRTLENEGLIRRVKDSNGRQRNEVTLTEHARDLMCQWLERT